MRSSSRRSSAASLSRLTTSHEQASEFSRRRTTAPPNAVSLRLERAPRGSDGVITSGTRSILSVLNINSDVAAATEFALYGLDEERRSVRDLGALALPPAAPVGLAMHWVPAASERERQIQPGAPFFARPQLHTDVHAVVAESTSPAGGRR